MFLIELTNVVGVLTHLVKLSSSLRIWKFLNCSHPSCQSLRATDHILFWSGVVKVSLVSFLDLTGTKYIPILPFILLAFA